jgi:Transposase DDE domain
MTGVFLPSVKAAGGGGSFRIWEKDRARVEQDIVEGRPFDAFISERGRFDAMFDFMLRSGLWTPATEMRPSGLKKDNGIPYRLLNGVECLREMAGIDTPANCGPLLKDAYLLERIGFTAEKIEKQLARDRTVIDPESLSNHLARFTEQDLEAGFRRHVEAIRSKRWLRGGVYAVDGHDILIPYGQGYEGARRISQGAYGYKLLVLLNIQDGCEVIVGYILGGLQESEITMLRRMLARLEQTMGPLREWLKILLMDRGYWGTDLFCELKQDYGIDFVSRVRDEKLELNRNIQRQVEEADRSWASFEEERQFAGRQESQQVRVTALRPITLISDETPAHRQIAVNVVVAIQSHADGTAILDQNGKDISRTDYVTSLAPGRYGAKVRGLYRGRWGIENQGFRSLSQTWDIDRPAGHRYGAVLARLVFVFMIYNARHLFEKESRHRPDYAEQLRQMRSYGPGIGLAGAAIVVLTASGYCCALTARELLKLQKQRLVKQIERGLAAGKSVKEVMREIDGS